MKNNTVHIVFSGGGTGGHLFPGLAVAEQLTAMIPRLRITFCGGGKPLERQAATDAGFEYFALPSRPLPHAAREAVSFVVENLAGYLAAGRFLREEHVSAVVGLGGYVSVPMARAAGRRDVPLVLLEQNAIPGRATRWLARRATLICTAFDETAAGLRCRCPVRVTGNPIRFGFDCDTQVTLSTIAAGPEEREGSSRSPITHSGAHWALKCPALAAPPLQLLVLGGSGGARSLNENAPRALYKVRRQLENWRIVHQSGQSDLDATKSLYRKFDLPATVVPFIDDMPAMLRATDLAVCRAGGTTLAELSAAGVPASGLQIARNYQNATVKAGGQVLYDSNDAYFTTTLRIDKNGQVGLGKGKAREVPLAIKKAVADAKTRRDKAPAVVKAANARLVDANKRLDAAKAAARQSREQAFQDLVWALLNTEEFLFRH